MRNATTKRALLTAQLLLHRSLTFDEIAEETGVCIRTVRRDIELLAEVGFCFTTRGDNRSKRWRIRRGTMCPACSNVLS